MKKLIFEIDMEDDFDPLDLLAAPDEVSENGNAVYRMELVKDELGKQAIDACAELMFLRMLQRKEVEPCTL